MKKTPARTLRTKADKIMSIKVRAMGECLSCGRKDGLECCHLISRGEMCIRCHPANAVALCHQCHRHFTMRPHQWTEFIETKFPGRWQMLDNLIINHRASRVKVDWQKWIDMWEAA